MDTYIHTYIYIHFTCLVTAVAIGSANVPDLQHFRSTHAHTTHAHGLVAVRQAGAINAERMAQCVGRHIPDTRAFKHLHRLAGFSFALLRPTNQPPFSRPLAHSRSLLLAPVVLSDRVRSLV
jgi:hypothetical protein